MSRIIDKFFKINRGLYMVKDIETITEENNKFKTELLKAIQQDVAKINERLDKLDQRYDLVDKNLDKLFDIINNRKPRTVINTTMVTNVPRSRSFVEDLGIACGLGDLFE